MLWGLSTVDVLMLGVIALSVLIGLFRGLVFEVMSLAGWVVAYLVAKAYSPLAEPHLPIGAQGSAAQHAAAFVVVFVAALLVWALLSRLLRMLVRATPLSLVDRLLGALFGALRASVLLLAVATVVGMTPAARSSAWQQSQGAALLQGVLDGIRPLLPGEFGRYLPASI